ncbi:MAG: hypothetical protein Q8O67_21105 [Deltaproteobacteria bacterium]|nr:hypothetical protein [Deltaproteobacteria bacterium]
MTSPNAPTSGTCRAAGVAALFGAVSALLAGCPELPSPCVGAADCPPFSACVEGACFAQPVIADVDGDGSGLPVTGVGPGRAGAHRLQRALVVRGIAFDVVDAVTLLAADALATCGDAACKLTVLEQDGALMRVALPENLAPGLFTLVLASAGGAAAAEVFLLQGEPGPLPVFREVEAAIIDCPNGGRRLFFGVDVDGDGFLAVPEERGFTIVCNGGQGVQGPPGADGLKGADGATGPPGANGIDGINGINGINGIDGIDGQDGVDGRNGELDCDDDVCILPQLLVTGGDIDVGGSLFVQEALDVGGRADVGAALDVFGPVTHGGPLTVAGNILSGGSVNVSGAVTSSAAAVAGRPVATFLPANLFVDVTTEVELRAALDFLDGISVSQGQAYVIRMPVVSMLISSPILIARADGLRIQILGTNPGGRTVLSCPGGCFVIEDDGLGLLDNVDMQGPGAAFPVVGVAVNDARATIGATAVLRFFNQGITAANNAFVVVSPGAIADSCGTAFLAIAGAHMNASGTFASNCSVAGYSAQFKASMTAVGARATTNVRGITVQSGSALDCTNVVVTGSGVEGLFVTEQSHAACGGACSLAGNNLQQVVVASRIDVRAFGASRILLNACPAQNPTIDAGSAIAP